MTALQLLNALRECGCEPGVDGFDLTFDSVPPPHLARFLDVLHTAVRSLLTGRRWFAIDPHTDRSCGPYRDRGAGPLAYGALDPSKRLQHRVGLLCVEGDPQWDRIDPRDRLDVPDVFEPEELRPVRNLRRLVEAGEVSP